MRRFYFVFTVFLLFINYSISQTVQDCAGAQGICANTYYENNTHSGYGSVFDFGSSPSDDCSDVTTGQAIMGYHGN